LPLPYPHPTNNNINYLPTLPQYPSGQLPYQTHPAHYYIKFSNTWKTTPKVDTTVETISITPIPIPIEYDHIHPLKFHPQLSTYTNKSFIAPTKILEGQIER
jgi:hypothetical protein